MLRFLKQNRLVLWCLSVIVLLPLVGAIIDVHRLISIKVEEETLKQFVAAADPLSAYGGLGRLTWQEVHNIERFLHFKINIAGIIGDIVLTLLFGSAFALLAVIGSRYEKTGYSDSLRSLLRGFAGLYVASFFVIVVAAFAHQIIGMQIDLHGIFGIRISTILTMDIEDLFGANISSKPSLGLLLVFGWSLLTRIGKMIEDEESTV